MRGTQYNVINPHIYTHDKIRMNDFQAIVKEHARDELDFPKPQASHQASKASIITPPSNNRLLHGVGV